MLFVELGRENEFGNFEVNQYSSSVAALGTVHRNEVIPAHARKRAMYVLVRGNVGIDAWG